MRNIVRVREWQWQSEEGQGLDRGREMKNGGSES